MYLWSPDVLSSSSYAACLTTAHSVDANFPRMLNKVLNLEYRGDLPFEVIMSLRLFVDNIGNHHLNIPISAEAALILQFRNMLNR